MLPSRWLALSLFIAVCCVLAKADTSPAERLICAARRAAAAAPSSRAYNRLALGYARRARETGDPSFYERAHDAVALSLEAEPGNYGARRVRVWALLGQHKFAQALEAAQALNKEFPDDVIVYGFLSDAYTELGRYEEAVEAAQWMLDMRPGNIPGLTRAAYLREIHGEIGGAVELMSQALNRTPGSETEDRAWILSQLAHLDLSRGRAGEALELAEHALAAFPGYHYALAEQGRALLALNRPTEAVAALRKRYEAAPHPENLFELAAALEKAELGTEAESAFRRFEQGARAEMNEQDNCNRELIFYYADYADDPEEALRVAKEEISRRGDLLTRDAYAWALHRNGRGAEAWEQLAPALALNTQNVRILYRAGVVAAANGNLARATELFEESLAVNPKSTVADSARAALKPLAAEASNKKGNQS